MWNEGLDEAQAGIKIARININNLRYADDTTLTPESEELKSLLMKVKEENEKTCLKFNIQNVKIIAPSPITSWQTDGKTMADFIFFIVPIKLYWEKQVVGQIWAPNGWLIPCIFTVQNTC